MIISNILSKINVYFLTCRNSFFSFYTKQFHFYEIINIFFKFLNSKSSSRNSSSTTSSTTGQSDYGRSKSLEQPKRIAFPKSVTFNRDRSRSSSARQDQDSPLLKSMLQSDKSNIGVSYYCRSHLCTLRYKHGVHHNLSSIRYCTEYARY